MFFVVSKFSEKEELLVYYAFQKLGKGENSNTLV